MSSVLRVRNKSADTTLFALYCAVLYYTVCTVLQVLHRGLRPRDGGVGGGGGHRPSRRQAAHPRGHTLQGQLTRA